MTDWEAEAHALEHLASGLIGLPKDEARRLCADLGLHLRLVDWDEVKGLVGLSSDYRSDRITAEARSGVITKAEAG